MKKKNAGFSLIELVVVIAVMVVLMGVGASWIGRISGYRARECASKISSSLIQSKVQAMSKAVNTGDVYWMLERDPSDNKYYVTTCVTNNGAETYRERIKVGKTSNITVKYVTKTDSEYVITTDRKFVLAYARNTGEIYTFLGNSMPTSTTDYVDSNHNNSVKQIMVTNGTRTYRIDVTAKTGKVTGVN